MGAWIEIQDQFDRLCDRCVAPLVGAWIEIQICQSSAGNTIVAPLVGAWIEIEFGEDALANADWSLPSWERGLKYCEKPVERQPRKVAPLVGAWIEIMSNGYVRKNATCRSPRGSVD